MPITNPRPEGRTEEIMELNIKIKGHPAFPLEEYIRIHYGSQKAFAESQGIKTSQVTQWKNKGFIVVDGVLYSPRRDLEQGLRK